MAVQRLVAYPHALTAEEVVDGFYAVLNILQGIETLACDRQDPGSCETPGYRFGKLAGLLAAQLATCSSQQPCRLCLCCAHGREGVRETARSADPCLRATAAWG